jgi:hypothetical protein
MVKFLSPSTALKIFTNHDLTDTSQRGRLLRLSTRQHTQCFGIAHIQGISSALVAHLHHADFLSPDAPFQLMGAAVSQQSEQR